MNTPQITPDMHPLAQLAIQSVVMRKTCGRFSTFYFALRNGVAGLYRKALQLEAVG